MHSALDQTSRDSREKCRKARAPVTERVAGWSARHRKTAVFGWLLLIAAIFMAGQAIGSGNLPQYDAGQAGQAERSQNQVAPAQYNAFAESVLIQARAPGVTFANNASMRQAAREVAAALSALPKSAAGIRSPLSAGGQSLVSKDDRSALVTFQVPGNVADVSQAATADQNAVAAVQARHPDLRIAESGGASIQQAINNDLTFSKAEGTSLPVTLILLLIVFGALVAAGIPLLLAVTSVAAAIGVLTIVSHLLPVASSIYEVVVIIGMAVGVDYSLFYLRREREERASGRSFPEALRIASRTSGRTILVSGVTVMAALCALFLVGGGPFAGIAAGTIAVVAIAVAGSLTVLPALLAWLGPRADKGRIPFLGRRRAAARPSRAWAALARSVVARPVIWGGLAAIALLALAAPALGLRIGQPPIDAPYNLPVVQTMTAIEHAFPQAPAPAEVVVTGPDVTGPTVAAAVGALRAQTTAGGPLRGPVTATSIGGGRALVVNVQLAGNGEDTASYTALTALRDKALPATLGKVPGISYAVAGDTAVSHDDVQVVHDNTPLVFAVVAVLAFLVLLAGFRSVAVPVVSIVLEPAIGGGGLRADHADLPGRAAAGTARLHLLRRDHLVGAAVHVRVPVRDQHGLPRVHSQPRPRALDAGLLAAGGNRRRHLLQRRRGHQRRADHGGALLDLRHAAADRAEGHGRRHGRRHPDRRHRRPRRPAPGGPVAARRPRLAPAPAPAATAGEPARRGRATKSFELGPLELAGHGPRRSPVRGR